MSSCSSTTRGSPVTVPRRRSPSSARGLSTRRRTRATPAPNAPVNDWILFLDADCPGAGGAARRVLHRRPPGHDVGALAGEVVAGRGRPRRSPRATARRASFLSQAAHLAHPYRPRAVAANLMVRREPRSEQVGGFYEGVRAAEDTDFSWRLQQAGWRLELRPDARVEHVYRSDDPRAAPPVARATRPAGRGSRRRYEGFEPEPALRRVLRGRGRLIDRHGRAEFDFDFDADTRRRRRPPAPTPRPAETTADARSRPSRFERARHLVLDAVLAVEELAGFCSPTNRGGAATVLVSRSCSSPSGSPPRTTRSPSSRGRSRVSGSRRRRGRLGSRRRRPARCGSTIARTTGRRRGRSRWLASAAPPGAYLAGGALRRTAAVRPCAGGHPARA